MKYIVGIDEVGRGPLAGPVTVAVFAVTAGVSSKWKDKSRKGIMDEKIKKIFLGARDSKRMSAKKREEIFKKVKQVQKETQKNSDYLVRYIVQNESAKTIDRKGISFAIKNCIKKCLRKLVKDLNLKPENVLVLLDGGIKAPPEFIYQQTIIKGDDKEIMISLASICAKVTRDTYMHKMAKKYPEYGFEKHVGYGTKLHQDAIQKYGSSSLHRKSFLGRCKM